MNLDDMTPEERVRYFKGCAKFYAAGAELFDLLTSKLQKGQTLRERWPNAEDFFKELSEPWARILQKHGLPTIPLKEAWSQFGRGQGR